MMFNVGDRVMHRTENRPFDSYGLGTVIKVDELNSYPVITVRFDEYGDEFEFSDEFTVRTRFKIFEDFAFIDFSLSSLSPA